MKRFENGNIEMNLESLSDEAWVKRISEQEQRIVFDQFGIELAHDIGMELRKIAHSKSLPIAIDVTRNGQCLFHSVLDGATPDNAEWIKRKIRVVQRFNRSSLYMGALCRVAGKSLEEKYLLAPNQFAPYGGAFPITIRNSGVIGSVTVSGLPQIEDHEFVVSVLEKFV